jgi:hypothetical protein
MYRYVYVDVLYTVLWRWSLSSKEPELGTFGWSRSQSRSRNIEVSALAPGSAKVVIKNQNSY